MFMDFCGLEKKASEIKVCVCVFSLSVWLFATPWT